MNVQYLFNSRGEWIAFKKGKYVYDTNGEWVGWLPWDNNDVVDVSGNYLGTIFNKNRFFKVTYKPYRGYPGYPGYPGYAGYSPLPPNATDIELKQSK
ncbi:MAG: 4-fold beta flower protein [Pyrinomonadaceae bacterium]